MRRIFPSGKSHILFAGICSFVNNFGSRMPVNCPVHHILHFFKKINAYGVVFVVINGCGINIFDFGIKYFFGTAYIPDAFEQFIKIGIGGTCFFQAFIVQYKTFNDIFFELLGCPDAKLSTSVRFYTITHRNNDIEIVV